MAASALEAVLVSARAREAAGDLAGAVKALERASATDQASGLWSYARGAMAFRQGHLDEAVGFFERAVAKEPEIAEYRANLGAVWVEQAKAKVPGALERAAEVLTAALRWGPTLPTTHANLGLVRLLEGKADEALALFDRALAKDPKDLASLYNRAVALEQLGRRKESLASLDAALSVAPTFEPALTSKKHLLAKPR
jgi:tetratricopeptide (TPR) repeat protein